MNSLTRLEIASHEQRIDRTVSSVVRKMKMTLMPSTPRV